MNKGNIWKSTCEIFNQRILCHPRRFSASKTMPMKKIISSFTSGKIRKYESGANKFAYHIYSFISQLWNKHTSMTERFALHNFWMIPTWQFGNERLSALYHYINMEHWLLKQKRRQHLRRHELFQFLAFFLSFVLFLLWSLLPYLFITA